MSDALYENWVPIIGLEIHVQLNTKTKMFGTEAYAFGHEPNLDIGVVATGQPGALPVVNRDAVKKAIQFGCAIKSNIALFTRFDRKSYFYPDNPKNFQITQFDHPIITGGVITCDVDGKTKHFLVHHAHLEEDSGMLKHFTNFTGVDFNRSGVPLLEIVSEPCMHSPKDASSYAMAVKAIMEFLDASNGNMEDGSLRVDVNISVRRKDETELRTKVEIKNLNSFSKMEAAIESEIRRQVKFYSDHPHETLERGTYRFDLDTNQVVLMRTKESAEDYRYFPEPDIPPIYITESYIAEIKASLPELPYDRLNRYLKEYSLSPQMAAVLTGSKRLSDYFEQTLSLHPNPKAIAMWMTVEFAGRLKDKGQALWDAGITPSHLAELISLIDKNTITGKIAKSVADEMVLTPHLTPSHIVHLNPDFQPIHDTSAIEPIVDRILADNPQSIADFRAGKTKAFGFLVGQVMKECRGKASPDIVNTLIQKKIVLD